MSKGILINFKPEVKKRLKDMADELGMSQTDLVRMATESLLVNYEVKGSFIFADLLNPEHKIKK